MVLRKGDPDAGGILLVLRGREGMAVLSQVRVAEGAAAWIRGTGATPVDQEAADAYVVRQLRFDPDLWVVEFDFPRPSAAVRGQDRGLTAYGSARNRKHVRRWRKAEG